MRAELRRAEAGEVALDDALAALNAVPSLERRRVLATYAAVELQRQ